MLDTVSSDGVIKELLKDENLNFDGHGEVIMKLAGKKMFDSLKRLLKAPFS